MSSVDAVAVVMPARNERARIGRALEAIVGSAECAPVPCAVVVVDDDSSDGTADIARSVLVCSGVRHRVVEADVHQASRARALGVEHARDLVAVDAGAVWLLSTDADSVVPPDWIVRYLDHAAAGAEAVAGVIGLIDDADGRRADDAWARDYPPTLVDPSDHPHVHAANLGIRLDVYDAAGGFADAARAEDIDLWRRVRELGVRPVADAELELATSARLDGRVELGFAAALRRLVAP